MKHAIDWFEIPTADLERACAFLREDLRVQAAADGACAPLDPVARAIATWMEKVRKA